MSIQLNVQQQNELAFKEMFSTAKHFRRYGVAPGIQAFLATHGININACAVVWAQTESYMLGFEHGLGGLIITPEKRFFEFELELNPKLTEVTCVHKFHDVTAAQNLSEHNKGRGKGYGAQAVAVLDAVNAI